MLSSYDASFECHHNFNTQCRAQLKTVNPTRRNGFDSHILKSVNQTKIKSPKQKTSIIQRTHSVNRRFLNATPAFRYQSTLILILRRDDGTRNDVFKRPTFHRHQQTFLSAVSQLPQQELDQFRYR